jgi:hypothetical protein
MDSLKAAILGTQHPDVHETEREILLAAGTAGFRQMAGYTPAKMPIHKPTFPPLAEKFVELSDIILHAICGETAHNNPRVPYLALIWLLVGRSNTYRLNQYLVDDLRLRQIAEILMRIAVSLTQYSNDSIRPIVKRIDYNWRKYEPKDEFGRETHYLTVSLFKALYTFESEATRFPNASKYINHALRDRFVMTDGIKSALRKCVETWQCLPDEELFQIMSQLMLDILPLENSAS